MINETDPSKKKIELYSNSSLNPGFESSPQIHQTNATYQKHSSGDSDILLNTQKDEVVGNGTSDIEEVEQKNRSEE